MSLTEKDIEKVVAKVLSNLSTVLPPQKNSDETNSKIIEKAINSLNSIEAKVLGEKSKVEINTFGVFEDVEWAINRAYEAQKELISKYKIADREKFISSIRKKVLEHKEELSRIIVEETKMGKYEDKIVKHELAANKNPGTELLTTTTFSGDNGITTLELSPFGVIGAVTPSTNPSETVVCNSISMIAAGNSVVFNAHPNGKKAVEYAVKIINEAIIGEGGPENLVTMVKEPTMATLDAILKSPKIAMLCGTGGPGLVKALLSSGKKVVGAGAGNPPVIVDDTADLKKAAEDIVTGASFDNNLPCICEKEVFVLEKVSDELIHNMIKNKSYLLTYDQIEKIKKLVLIENSSGSFGEKSYSVNKDWVGKDAALILSSIGVTPVEEVRLLICETEADHPFVVHELMMPILPIVKVKDIDEAIELAVKVEHGNKHSAHIHSKNVDNLRKFEKAIDTAVFVKNSTSFAAVGYGGEGFGSFTIASATGEGITSPITFSKIKRVVLAHGR